MIRKILIATDGSERSGIAIQFGIELAQALGAAVVGFTATEPYPVKKYGEFVLADALPPDKYHAHMAELVERRLGAIGSAANAAGVAYEAFTLVADAPSEGIITAANAKGCDLICMASHGRGAISGFLLGSETQKVLAQSRVPVVVCRAQPLV